MNETPAILAPLERLLNRQFEGNSDARKALAAVAGETLAIKLEGLAFDIYMHAQDDRLQLASDYTDEPAAIISGTPLALAAMASTAGDSSAVRKTGVTIHGDPAVAQGFQRLLEIIKPDWEEELARLVGDSAAHQLGVFARRIFGWGKELTGRVTEDFARHFTERGEDLPNKADAETFFDDVDDLRNDVERADARLNALAKRL